MKSTLAFILCIYSCSVFATTRAWLNELNLPSVLTSAVAATVLRVEDPGFQAHTLALDDFVFNQTTTVSEIGYFAVVMDTPTVLGADWYIYDGQGNTPNYLIASNPGEPVQAQFLGFWFTGDPIFRISFQPQNLTLPPGHYYLGLRTQATFTTCTGYCKIPMLVTNIAKGNTSAIWGADIDAFGNLNAGLYPLSLFNQIPLNEWAFYILGQ